MVNCIHVNSLACVRVEGGVRGVYHVLLALQCQCLYGRSDEGGENGVGEEGREWILPGLLNADDLGLCGGLEKDLRAMVGRFVEVCKRRGLKVNAGKSKVMVLGGEEGLECEVCVDGIRLDPRKGTLQNTDRTAIKNNARF